MEIIPIVNENDQQIGSINKAKFDKTKGDIYRTVAVILVDSSNGLVLIQRRSAFKETYANKWQFSSAAGHVQVGETYEQAAARETEEELGVKIKEDKLVFIDKIFITTNKNKRRFMSVFSYDIDLNNVNIKIMPKEVGEAKIISKKELIEMTELESSSFMDDKELIKQIIYKIFK